MGVLGVADSPGRPRSAGYAEKGYPNYAEAELDVCAPSTLCRSRSARYSEKGYPDYAEPEALAVSPPCRPRSARYAAKEPDEPRGHKRNEGVMPAMKPAAEDGRKRRSPAADAAEAVVHMVTPLLQGEEAVARHGRKRRMTTAAPMATALAVAAEKVFPLPNDNEEVEHVDGGVNEHGDGGGGGKSWRMRVKETLRTFSCNYLHFVQEEQQRAEAVRQELKAARALKCQIPGKYGKTKSLPEQQLKGWSKKGNARGRKLKNAIDQDDGNCEEVKRPSKRPDLKALSKMQATNTMLYPDKRIGNLPGIHVGDQFYSRAEMVVLGIHGHWLKGIDYMGTKYCGKRGYENFTFPFATSIVMSGAYEDDLDKADEIIYTGEGGNNLLGNRHQKSRQTLVRGNLALKNSKDNGNPIRVIRGHSEKSSYTGKVYTYDGVYKVVNYVSEEGVRGHLVFKFTLKRLEGQPPLTTSRVLFTRGDDHMPIPELPGLVCADISCGQENLPIPATNLVDDPPIAPSGFVYSKLLQIPDNIKMPADSIGCNCKGDCSSSKHCMCADRNGSDLPYVSRQRKVSGKNKDSANVGRLVEPKAVVFECGASCSCNCSCVNRTSQQGLQYRVEVFKTGSKGWGVRTRETILPGALICEYTGVLQSTSEVEDLMENNYIFDIDCLQTIKGLDGREQRSGSELHIASLHEDHDLMASQAPEYCIDAGSVGNLARFINHSCEPNLFIQCVLSSHRDIKLAKIMLFAADTIPPLQELSYDYGYRLDSVIGADGNVIKLACHCGASNCRGQLY